MANRYTNSNYQTTMYDEVWGGDDEDKKKKPLQSSLLMVPPTGVTTLGKPAGLKSGMRGRTALPWITIEDPNPPYWEFSYAIHSGFGLKLYNVRVVNSQTLNSIEHVFDSIEFADLEVTFANDTVRTFDIANAFQNSASFYRVGENGKRKSDGDDLFQRGVKVVLVEKFNGIEFTVELSVVFRGAKNDFDPSGAPVAMMVWPEISWTWKNINSQTKVKAFRGSVKVTVKNTMAHSPLVNANVASLFTDSNTGFIDEYRPTNSGITGIIESFAAKIGRPLGWARLFDYVKLNLQEEYQFVAVYGPTYGDFWKMWPSVAREKTYWWPTAASGKKIRLKKAPRQGYYDNVHIHGKMEPAGTTPVQVHAPFCGHSCVHMHWRWSSAAVNAAASGKSWYYKGWSVSGLAHTQDDAPLVPPNQHVMVAICKAGTTPAQAATDIINKSAPQTLDPLLKTIYYRADIHEPSVGDRQVICSHGIGWAFRYALLSEPDNSIGLMISVLKYTVQPTNSQKYISDFFVNTVYPTFRYIDGKQAPDQVPSEGVNTKSMEEL